MTPHDAAGPLDHVTDEGQSPAFAPSNPQERRTHDDILRVLADFQTGLESLKTLHAQREELQARLKIREEELTQLDHNLREEHEAHAKAEAALADRMRELEAARAEQARKEAELEERAREVREAVSRGDEATTALHTALEEQTRRGQTLAERTKEIQGLKERGESVSGELEAERAAHARDLDMARAERDQRQAELAQRTGDLEAATRRADEAAAALAADHDMMAELERTVAVLQGRIKAEASKREAEAARANTAEAALTTASAEKDRFHAESAVKLAQAQAEANSLRDAMCRAEETMRAHPRRRGGEALDRRRARLLKYRAAVKLQSVKVRKASEALGKRYTQCELVLKQRAELAAVRERVLDAERKVVRQRAGSRAGIVTFCAVAVIGILGALSWALSNEVAPAKFVAEATLKAEGRGRELNEAELEEWGRFHAELVADPMFQEAAAQRFARQGMADLGSPHAVNALVKNQIASDVPTPGELSLRMTGEGRDRTRRTLDAFAASVASYANAAGSRRVDGGATVMAKPAHADDHPVDNTRTVYALAMLGAGVCGSGMLALTMWRKLSRVKTSFEYDSQAAAVLAEARWVTPELISPAPKARGAEEQGKKKK